MNQEPRRGSCSATRALTRPHLSRASYSSFCSAWRPCRPHCRFAVARTEDDIEIESGEDEDPQRGHGP